MYSKHLANAILANLRERLAGADPCPLGSAISRRDLWELMAHPGQLVKQLAAGEDTRAKALPEESPFGRSQTLKSNRPRQPVV
jgi:hypothetical protein